MLRSLVLLGALAASINLPAKGVSPEITGTVNDLEQGNQRFRSGKVRHDGQSQADVQRLSKGQSPKAAILSCSDSRVPPEIVLDQKLGELFTVRTAGETLSPTTIASLEFAVARLKTHLIVVMGHTNCGAVTAAVQTRPGESAGSPNLDQLVADIRPHFSVKDSPSPNFRREGLDNAKGVTADLLKRSSLLSEAVKSGQVHIVTALYDLESGKVEFSN